MKKLETCCIIDDDPIFIYGTKRVIRDMDLAGEVIVFNNGQQAADAFLLLAQSGQRFPQIIFLDLNMPILDGWNFLEYFRDLTDGHECTTSIYVMSSSIDPRDMERVKSYPMVAEYLLKPMSPAELTKILHLVTR